MTSSATSVPNAAASSHLAIIESRALVSETESVSEAFRALSADSTADTSIQLGGEPTAPPVWWQRPEPKDSTKSSDATADSAKADTTQ